MITLNKYIEELQKIAKTHPSFGELPMIYAEDDEGNGYQKVMNPPSLFSVENIEDDYHLQPNLEVLEKAGQSIDTESEDFKNLNCIIVN
jgi:hypothetical protein